MQPNGDWCYDTEDCVRVILFKPLRDILPKAYLFIASPNVLSFGFDDVHYHGIVGNSAHIYMCDSCHE